VRFIAGRTDVENGGHLEIRHAFPQRFPRNAVNTRATVFFGIDILFQDGLAKGIEKSWIESTGARP
jgi:hypothetical protein